VIRLVIRLNYTLQAVSLLQIFDVALAQKIIKDNYYWWVNSAAFMVYC